MTAEMIYLDSAATTIPLKENIAFFKEHYTFFFNPSALYKPAVKVLQAINRARAHIAAALEAEPDEIFFTSSASEANNHFLRFYKPKDKKKKHILCFASAHPSVLKAVKHAVLEPVIMQPPAQYKIDFNTIKNRITPQTAVVSVTHVNNESGVINDIEDIGRNLKKKHPGIIFHVDAVQSFLKIPVSVKKQYIDVLSLSAHKIHSFSGTGVLFKKKNIHLDPLFFGGSQEKNLRAGTENIPSILSLGNSVQYLQHKMQKNYRKVKNLFINLKKALAQFDCFFFTDNENILSPYILNFAVKNIRSEIMIRLLAEKNIYISPSSACSSTPERTRVLQAYRKKPAYLNGALRASFSPFNTAAEIKKFIFHFQEALEFFK